LADAAGLFADKRAKGGGSDEDLTDRLYQQIGQLKVEPDWLKEIRAWQCQRRLYNPQSSV
jgi:hypothetical protein